MAIGDEITPHPESSSVIPDLQGSGHSPPMEEAQCVQCDGTFSRRADASRKKIYCSVECDRQRKKERSAELRRAEREKLAAIKEQQNKDRHPEPIILARDLITRLNEIEDATVLGQVQIFDKSILRLANIIPASLAERVINKEAGPSDLTALAMTIEKLPQIRRNLLYNEDIRPPRCDLVIEDRKIAIGQLGRYESLGELLETEGPQRQGDTLLRLMVAKPEDKGKVSPKGRKYIIEAALPLWADHGFQDILLYGGRGSGKSYAVAQRVIAHALEKPHKILCVRQFATATSSSSKALITGQIHDWGLEDEFEFTERNIRCKNGSIFLFHGMERSYMSLKSMEGVTIFWGEEADMYSKLSVDTLMPTIRDDASISYFTLNPKFAEDAVYDMFLGDIPPEDSLAIKINHPDNPFFSEKLRKQSVRAYKLDHDYAEHIWMGELRKTGMATVFSPAIWRIEAIQPPKNAIVAYGVDFGIKKALTAIVRARVWRTDTGNISVYIEAENTKRGAVKEKDFPDFVYAVGVEGGQRIRCDQQALIGPREGRKGGFEIVHAAKGGGSIFEGVRWLQNCDIIVNPRCRVVIEELRRYSYKVDKSTGQPDFANIEKEYDHTIDALRYAMEEFIFGNEMVP